MAWPLGQAARWHHRVHARRPGQPSRVSAKWRTTAWTWLPTGDAGGSYFAINRGGVALGERSLSGARQRGAGAVPPPDALSERGRHPPREPLSLHLRTHLLNAVSTMILSIRPGRIEPHAIKRRPKNHALLTVPRAVARAAIIRARRAYA